MNLIAPFLRIQNQIKVFHWQTESYAQHKAFDKTYKDFSDLVDQFVEVYMGKYGRSRAKLAYNIELQNLGEDFLSIIDSYIQYLINLNNDLDSVEDSDLLNIRDEMLAVFNRLKYLLMLN